MVYVTCFDLHSLSCYVRFFFRPVTLTVLAFALGALAYIATTEDVLQEGRDKRRVYVLDFLLHPFGIL